MELEVEKPQAEVEFVFDAETDRVVGDSIKEQLQTELGRALKGYGEVEISITNDPYPGFISEVGFGYRMTLRIRGPRMPHAQKVWDDVTVSVGKVLSARFPEEGKVRIVYAARTVFSRPEPSLIERVFPFASIKEWVETVSLYNAYRRAKKHG